MEARSARMYVLAAGILRNTYPDYAGAWTDLDNAVAEHLGATILDVFWTMSGPVERWRRRRERAPLHSARNAGLSPYVDGVLCTTIARATTERIRMAILYPRWHDDPLLRRVTAVQRGGESTALAIDLRRHPPLLTTVSASSSRTRSTSLRRRS